ncbi:MULTISPECIES: hypothetical protein [Corynebacterium]|uniref:hypothetical protein n=1 Tax=Corynebacterium TaxID=1716 RepID=UPI0008A50E25|nr:MULTISPECIES: hypothetical protein [unclassified Corynebacterium]MDK6812535.1 hypothetical protein [Corynebacterium sp. UMB6689]OFQ36211.1 hypothetical protein HMPREF2943_09910 [Corynebacterium sp. HMSC072D12]
MTLRDRTAQATHRRDHERTHTMGASRDFTTGADATGQGTALLERGRRTTPLPSRTPHRGTVPTRRVGSGLRGSRLGSKQVVSNRGRRVSQPTRVNGLFARLSFTAIALLITGVAAAMWLSGLSTSQTFKIQELTAQESTLDNQLETLNRDLENVRSASDVARRAHEAKMGIPVQPGVVEVGADGNIEHKREATPDMESVIDVNGEPVRPGQASSDPNATANMSDNLNARPTLSERNREGGGAATTDAHSEDSPEGGQPGEASVELPDIPAQAPYAARG